MRCAYIERRLPVSSREREREREPERPLAGACVRLQLCMITPPRVCRVGTPPCVFGPQVQAPHWDNVCPNFAVAACVLSNINILPVREALWHVDRC